MAALTADKNVASRISGLRGYPVLNDTIIYKGALVAVDNTGYLVPASDAAALRVVGVADEHVESPSTDSDGDKWCKVQSGRDFLVVATSITQAMVGDVMFVVDDQTVDDVAGTNGVPAGRLVDFVSTTAGWIHIPDGGLRKAGIAAATYDATEAAMVNDILT